MERQKHFVLVHGACHGAWCWYKVATLLTSAGHKVTALDMAASGVHPKRVEELHAISDYFEPLMEFMTSLPPEERVILVGHSMGGLSNSVAMERFPEKISCAVFAACIMPGPDLSFTAAKEEVSFALFYFFPFSLHTHTQKKLKASREGAIFFMEKRRKVAWYLYSMISDFSTS